KRPRARSRGLVATQLSAAGVSALAHRLFALAHGAVALALGAVTSPGGVALICIAAAEQVVCCPCAHGDHHDAPNHRVEEGKEGDHSGQDCDYGRNFPAAFDPEQMTHASGDQNRSEYQEYPAPAV